MGAQRLDGVVWLRWHQLWLGLAVAWQLFWGGCCSIRNALLRQSGYKHLLCKYLFLYCFLVCLFIHSFSVHDGTRISNISVVVYCVRCMYCIEMSWPDMFHTSTSQVQWVSHKNIVDPGSSRSKEKSACLVCACLMGGRMLHF